MVCEVRGCGQSGVSIIWKACINRDIFHDCCILNFESAESAITRMTILDSRPDYQAIGQ